MKTLGKTSSPEGPHTLGTHPTPKNLFFCFCFQGSSSGGMDLIFFKKVPSNFTPLSGTGKILTTRPEGSGKTENLNFIKFAENRNGAKTKQ